MKHILVILPAAWILLATTAWAQVPTGTETTEEGTEAVREKAEQLAEEARAKSEEIAEHLDKSQAAQEASAGLLKPIYLLAEKMAFPAFHWVAFTLMAAGVVSFALQLVFAKLVVLSKLSLSISEVLSDALGLAISLVGLVLTTQAATENSNFTESPASVLSASAAGVVIGLIFYRWGQKQELQAVEGRKKQEA